MKYFICITLIFILGLHALHAQTARGLGMPADEKPKVEGKTYALIIGISKYKSLPSLQFADKDARAFYNFLKSPAGGNVDTDNIRMILNEKACAADIWIAVGWLLRKANQPGDKAFIYYSGHGDAANAEEAYLLAHDAPNEGDPNLYNAGGTVQIFNLKAKIKLLSAAGVQVVLITDACRSNELPGKAEGSRWAFEKIMEKQAGEIQMASCSSNEQSQESTAWGGGRGVFSYYLINGLAGMADDDGDGKITFFEIQQYLLKNVRKDTKSPSTGKPKQTPVFCCGEYSDVVLGIKDEQFLSQLNKSSTNNNLLADAGSKGINLVEPELKDTYTKYLAALNADKLIEPKDTCAEAYLHQLLARVKDEDTRADLTDALVGKLINEAQTVINDYSKGADQVEHESYYDYFFKAAEKLNTALPYIQDKGYYNELNAARLFLEAKAIDMGGDHTDNKLTEAIAKGDSSLATEGDRAYVLLTLGDLIWYAGDHEKGLTYYYKALNLANKWIYPNIYIGECFDIDKHQYDSSAYYYKRAIAFNPKEELGYLKLALNYISRNHTDSAISCVRQSINIKPNSEKPYANAAFIYMNLGQSDSAIYYCNKSAQINPGNENTFLMLSQIYQFMKKPDSALYYSQKAVRLNPNRVDILQTIASFNLTFGQFDSAVYYFRKTVHLAPEQAVNYKFLGVSFARLNQRDSAAYYYRKAITLNPADDDAYYHAVNNLVELNEPDSALLYVRKLLTLNPNNPKGMQTAGDIFLRTGISDSAFYYYNKIMDLEPQKFASYYNLACLYSTTGNLPLAIENFNKCLTFIDKEIDDELILIQGEAVKKEFKNRGMVQYFDHFQKDPDIAALRTTPDFKTLMKKYFPDQYKE